MCQGSKSTSSVSYVMAWINFRIVHWLHFMRQWPSVLRQHYYALRLIGFSKIICWKKGQSRWRRQVYHLSTTVKKSKNCRSMISFLGWQWHNMIFLLLLIIVNVNQNQGTNASLQYIQMISRYYTSCTWDVQHFQIVSIKKNNWVTFKCLFRNRSRYI